MIELFGILLPWIFGWFLKMSAILIAALFKFFGRWLVLGKRVTLQEIMSETGTLCCRVSKADVLRLWKTLKADQSCETEKRKDQKCQ